MWRIEGDEVVWTGREPYRHPVGERAVFYWPGERLSLERAEELGLPVEAPPAQARPQGNGETEEAER
ncbi:MAG TPA: hypothetical protein VNO79_01405 [Actinomycetota bacterium]|nr:hypothetical protein [Actinomycetota bacterium]